MLRPTESLHRGCTEYASGFPIILRREFAFVKAILPASWIPLRQIRTEPRTTVEQRGSKCPLELSGRSILGVRCYAIKRKDAFADRVTPGWLWVLVLSMRP